MSDSGMSLAMREQAREDWLRLISEFRGESDRAAALVGAALLDDNLERLLKLYLVDDDFQVERMLGSGLRTLGARIRACYCLGLISRDERADMACIQAIRNYFAHNLHVSFEDEGVNDSCRRLKMITPLLHGREVSKRVRFERTVCMLSMLIVQRQEIAAQSRLQVRPNLAPELLSMQCPLWDDNDIV